MQCRLCRIWVACECGNCISKCCIFSYLNVKVTDMKNCQLMKNMSPMFLLVPGYLWGGGVGGVERKENEKGPKITTQTAANTFKPVTG